MGAHEREAMFCDSQSRPSYRPSPLVAHVLWMYLWRQASNEDSQASQLEGSMQCHNNGVRLTTPSMLHTCACLRECNVHAHCTLWDIDLP